MKERRERKQEEKERVGRGEYGGESPVYRAERGKKDGHMAPAVREGSAPRSVIIASGRGN